jgi:GntR family transcriptional regulator, transcriptional repressor for pyruvate dehydrogenase complex
MGRSDMLQGDAGLRSVSKATPVTSAVDELVDRIRDLIRAEGLGIGDNLPTERDLCERFGASRNTVREAMRMFKAFGMVTVRPKVGATIVDDRMARAIDLFTFNTLAVSRETFRDIQGFRVLLEVASVDMLMGKITPTDITDLRVINAGLSAAKSVAEASEADFRFHTRLVHVLGNKAMLDVYGIMRPIILRIMELGKTRRTFQTSTQAEHEAIILALSGKDRVAYQYHMKTHLEAGFSLFQSGTNDHRIEAKRGTP